MDRIKEHPILGTSPVGKKYLLSLMTKVGRSRGRTDCSSIESSRCNGTSLYKKRHEPRGIFCAIGRCTDCVMIVNGRPNVRTCITPLEEGMKVKTQYGVSDTPETE